MTSKVVTVSAEYGKQADGIAKLVQLACTFDSEVRLAYGTKSVNAKSIMGIMAFTADVGEEVTISADGPDEEAAVNGMVEFLS